MRSPPAPSEMDRTDDPERFVRLLGAVIELWGPMAAVATWAGPAAGADELLSTVDQAWRVELPETVNRSGFTTSA